MNSDTYKTITGTSQEYTRRKEADLFLLAIPVTDQEQIKPIIDKIRKEHHDARHHCYAYMLGI